MNLKRKDLPPIEEIPAAHLEGRDLGNGWKVGSRVIRAAGATGGTFSIGYVVEHDDKRVAFLKALNLPSAMSGAGEFLDELNDVTSAYIFERDLFAECRDRKLTRVITLIDHGEVLIPEAGPFLSKVPYLIFEKADGDIRLYQAALDQIDCAWAFRVMKHTLEGLEQLHAGQTAHQDLKPSNVLTQNAGMDMKLGDLGRADRRSVAGPWSEHKIPGAIVYAPPEQHYGSFSRTWEARKASDLYLAGSLGAQLFTGHCMSSLIQAALPMPFRIQHWRGTFPEVVPFLRSAHTEVLASLEQVLGSYSCDQESVEQFVNAVAQLTDPDPAERGHPRDRAARTSSYAVRRYISLMDVLSARARFRTEKNSTRG